MNTIKLSTVTSPMTQSHHQVYTTSNEHFAGRFITALKAEIADCSTAFKVMLKQIY